MLDAAFPEPGPTTSGRARQPGESVTGNTTSGTRRWWAIRAGPTFLLLAACAGPRGPDAETVAPDADLAAGRALTEAFFAGELPAIWSRMTLEMRDAAGGSLEELTAFRRKVDELAGDELDVVHEEVTRGPELVVYRRTSRFSRSTEPMAIQWAVDSRDSIAEFFIRPVESAASVDYRTRTELRLPFSGEWYVTAGGRTVEQNQHTLDFSNRFAYDLVSAEDLELTETPAGNEGFATWGRPILAPAGGTVAAVRDGIPDNAPGDSTRKQAAMGNFVSIDHGRGEFSVLGHLQRGSVRVAVGDRVEAGDVVGLAGNSGNSNGPHLHFNLQDRAEPNRGRGLPAQFVDYESDGRPVPRGEPERGERISPRPR